MTGKSGVTFMTRKPFPAASEFDRYDITFAVVMSTARFRIDIEADNVNAMNDARHVVSRSRGQTSTRSDPIIQHVIIITKPVLNEPVR